MNAWFLILIVGIDDIYESIWNLRELVIHKYFIDGFLILIFIFVVNLLLSVLCSLLCMYVYDFHVVAFVCTYLHKYVSFCIQMETIEWGINECSIDSKTKTLRYYIRNGGALKITYTYTYHQLSTLCSVGTRHSISFNYLILFRPRHGFSFSTSRIACCGVQRGRVSSLYFCLKYKMQHYYICKLHMLCTFACSTLQ